MTTIKEIADLAGVSRGTVDRVLNNRGAVQSKDSRENYEDSPGDELPTKPGRTCAGYPEKEI